jgi:hypothetical protein
MDRKALVVKVKKNNDGEITDVMLDNGKVHSIDEAISLSRDGYIEDIIVKQGENGKEYYRNNPTSLGDDSFHHIPEF